MMFKRRPTQDSDWQAELAARSAGTVSRSETAAPRKEAARIDRVRVLMWRLVTPLVLVVSWAETFIGRHHLVGAILLGIWISLIPFDLMAARRRKREREEAAEGPTLEERTQWELRGISRELRWIIDNPPERSVYEAWLGGGTQKLQRLSPQVADRWARPDPGRQSSRQVSAAELGARRARLLELYAEFAPPDNVELVSSELRQAPSARAITSS